jgi:hypothetical protein
MTDESNTRSRDSSHDVPLLVAAGTVIVIAVTVSIALTQAEELSSEAVAVIVGAAVPGAVSVVIAVLGHQERRRLEDAADRERARQRYEQLVIRSLEYFTGKTQRRNVGISVVEGVWEDTAHLRPLLVPLLLNQATYLLEQSKQVDSAHELDNLRRIMDLLIRARSGGQHEEGYRDLTKVVRKRVTDPDPNRTKGLRVEDEEIQEWSTRLAQPTAGQADAT